MIRQFLNSIYKFFQNLFKTTFDFLGNLFGYLFQKLIDFLKFLFSPVLILIALIFYFIYKLGVLVVKLLAVILGIGKIFFSLVKGIITTLAGFSWTPTSRNDGQWTSIFANMSQGMGSYQLDNVAYVLMFLIWFTTAFYAIRIISSMGGGSDE